MAKRKQKQLNKYWKSLDLVGYFVLCWNVVVFNSNIYLGQSLSHFIRAKLVCLSEFNPMPTDEIVNTFNTLRQDIVLLYELKLAMSTCEYELQTLKHRHDQLIANRVNHKFFVYILSSHYFNTSLLETQWLCNFLNLK